MLTKGKSSSTSSQHEEENAAAASQPRRRLPSPFLTVTAGEEPRQSARLKPPRALPAEFEVKIDTQLGWVELYEEATAALPADESGMNLAELDAQIEFMDQLHSEFRQEHQNLEVHFAVHLLDHLYAQDRVYMKSCRAYALFRRTALKIRSALAPPEATPRSEDRLHLGARSQ